jgi:hypothetical protein
MKHTAANLIVIVLLGVCLALVGCESGGGDADGGAADTGYIGTWAIRLAEVVASSYGTPPGSAEWDTTLVITESNGDMAGLLAGYEGYPLTEAAARALRSSSQDELSGVLPGNIQAMIHNLSVSGSTISGSMRWGIGDYGAWRSWTFSGQRQ